MYKWHNKHHITHGYVKKACIIYTQQIVHTIGLSSISVVAVAVVVVVFSHSCGPQIVSIIYRTLENLALKLYAQTQTLFRSVCIFLYNYNDLCVCVRVSILCVCMLNFSLIPFWRTDSYRFLCVCMWARAFAVVQFITKKRKWIGLDVFFVVVWNRLIITLCSCIYE